MPTANQAQRPSDIPTNPNTIYALEGWAGMGDWLGTGTIAKHLREYRPFGEARTFVQGLNLKSQSEWDAFANSGELPIDLPKAPHMVYADDGWVSWGDWLGTGTIATYKVDYRPFEQAREFARTLGLKSRQEWLAFGRTGKLPIDIPINPHRTYADQGWAGIGDWLGTGTIAAHLRKYRRFNEARAFVRTLRFEVREGVAGLLQNREAPRRYPDEPQHGVCVGRVGQLGRLDWHGYGRYR